MEEQNNYEINTKLLNDIKCNLHQCKKQYNKYCVTCNKNLCQWCEGHNNHQIIEFNSLDKGPELFKIYEEKLGKMESINKDFFIIASFLIYNKTLFIHLNSAIKNFTTVFSNMIFPFRLR